jgi:penicillin amidase
MVVELGDRPRAFGVYAGGQSGNVGSAYFDNFLDDWHRGRYFPLAFYLSAEEARREAGNVWRLEGRTQLNVE